MRELSLASSRACTRTRLLNFILVAINCDYRLPSLTKRPASRTSFAYLLEPIATRLAAHSGEMSPGSLAERLESSRLSLRSIFLGCK
jgi:hypothetical protein